MPRDNSKKFVNPLLRSSESPPEEQTQTPTEMTTETSTQPPTDTDTSTPTSTQTYTYTSKEDEEDYAVARRKRGKQAFENTHDRWTVWLDKKLKKRIARLAKEQEISISALADEAVADLLKKYGK